MAIETIEIKYDLESKKMMVGAPMETPEAKERTMRMLISAMKIVLDYEPAVIKPAMVMPVKNGSGLKVLH